MGLRDCTEKQSVIPNQSKCWDFPWRCLFINLTPERVNGQYPNFKWNVWKACLLSDSYSVDKKRSEEGGKNGRTKEGIESNLRDGRALYLY